MQETLDSLSLTDRSIRDRVNMGRRHELRDREFLHTLARHFRPGPILELGASTGHLALLLQENGYDVTGSEVEPKLVRAIASRGVKAALVDATQDIVTQTGETYANILAQGVIPLIRRDRDTVRRSLRAIHDALKPQGRLLCVSPYAWRQPNPGAFFSPKEQMEIARNSGLFEPVIAYPHQVVPPQLYRPWNAKFLNLLDHKLAWIARVRWVWAMEKRSGNLP